MLLLFSSPKGAKDENTKDSMSFISCFQSFVSSWLSFNVFCPKI